jgi:hypothetical protein
MVEQVEINIPETWDTIKYPKPIYPTYSRGKVGKYVFGHCNHCYTVTHSSPTYDLTPYRPTGFGFAERNQNYIPLSHVQDRSRPKRPRVYYEKAEITKIYENAIDTIRDKIDCTAEYLRKKNREEDEIRKIEGNYRNLVTKLKYETNDLVNNTDEMIGDVRYRAHLMNKLIRDGQALMTEERTEKILF